jgi:hypothetical protein
MVPICFEFVVWLCEQFNHEIETQVARIAIGSGRNLFCFKTVSNTDCDSGMCAPGRRDDAKGREIASPVSSCLSSSGGGHTSRPAHHHSSAAQLPRPRESTFHGLFIMYGFMPPRIRTGRSRRPERMVNMTDSGTKDYILYIYCIYAVYIQVGKPSQRYQARSM